MVAKEVSPNNMDKINCIGVNLKEGIVISLFPVTTNALKNAVFIKKNSVIGKINAKTTHKA